MKVPTMVATLALGLLANCSAPAIHGEFPLHGAPPPQTYAVVLPQTTWATAPLPDAHVVRPLPGQTTRYFGRLLGYRGGMAALEVGGPAGLHCAESLPNLSGMRLVLWVPRDRLAPVLLRPQRLRYPDGSGYDLAPGLPVGPPVADGAQPGQRYRPLSTPRFLTAAAVADRDVGVAYQPAPLPEAETSSEAQWIDQPTLPLGDGQLLRQPDSIGELWSDHVRPDPQDPSMVLVELEDRCAQFTVRVPASAMKEAVGGLILGALGSLSGGKAQVRANVRLYWPNGSSAGHTVSATRLGRPVLEQQGRKCFAVDMFGRSHLGAPPSRGVAVGELVVCAGVGDLSEPGKNR